MSNVQIILFRGVGGKTQLPVKALREKLEEAGFSNVATYINSGNAVVRTSLSQEQTIRTIADICRKEFSFEKDIFAPTLAEWRKLIRNNPFAREAAKAPTSVHAAVLAAEPPKGAVEKILTVAIDGEDIKVIGKVAYIHGPHGFGRSKMAAKFDKGIAVANTARNWNTVLKLEELAAKA